MNGTLSEKRFAKLSAEYEREQEELECSIADLRIELDRFDDQSTKADKFLGLVSRYTDFEELTTPMLNELIEKVVVHERTKEYRYQHTQKIDVYFSFVGMLELPMVETDAAESNDEPQKRYVAKTTSFTPLANYLEEQSASILNLSFALIEKIIGKKLCASALKYASYWYPAHDRPVSNIIFNSGYDVDRVDLKNQVITLKKPEQTNEKLIV